MPWPRPCIERRLFLQMLAATAASAGGLAVPAFAGAATREAVIEAAKGESGLVWYDHYDRAASEAILAAFRRAYPFVKQAEFVDVPSAQKTAKIIQESMAGGPTADVLLNGCGGAAIAVRSRLGAGNGLGARSGVATSPVMTPTPYMILALTPPYVVLYNTDLVKEADVPHSWDDAFDPKWKGHTGHWMRAAFFVDLLPAIGEDEVREISCAVSRRCSRACSTGSFRWRRRWDPARSRWR